MVLPAQSLSSRVSRRSQQVKKSLKNWRVDYPSDGTQMDILCNTKLGIELAILGTWPATTYDLCMIEVLRSTL